VVRCTKAAALRYEMRQHWSLPDEQQLLLLLSSLDGETKAKTLLLLWRAWHLGNDKGLATIKFLISYAISLELTGEAAKGVVSDKGKAKINEGAPGKES
jgi:hypothetical protein